MCTGFDIKYGGRYICCGRSNIKCTAILINVAAPTLKGHAITFDVAAPTLNAIAGKFNVVAPPGPVNAPSKGVGRYFY